MPCGYRDQRRQGYRCLQCRMHHNKCDSSRPCRACQRGKLTCEEPLLPPPDVVMIEYSPRHSYQPMGRFLISDSWLYVRMFFDAISCSDSPLLSVFCFEEIGQVVQRESPIFDAVTAVGATYANQTYLGLRLSSVQKTDIRKLCSTFRQYIAARISDPDALQDPSFLLSVQLFAFMELMTDKTGTRWNQLIRKLQPNFSRREHASITSERFNISLFKFIRMSFAFRNLMFHDDIPFITEFAEGPNDCLLPFGPQQEFPASSSEKIEFLTRMLERWAQLRNRSLNWIRNIANARASTLKPHSLQQALEGLQIVCLGCELQQEIITVILPGAASCLDFDSRAEDSMIPFYRWILTGLCRIFSEPAWLSLGWKLPVMQETMMNQQAVMALDYAEKSIERVQIEAIIYAPIVSVVGAEMSSAKDRGRVIRLLRNIEDKGFAVASAVESDVRLSWSGV